MSYKTTIDYEEIRSWVESHGGHPAVVKGTTTPDSFGTLRFDFTGDSNLERIDWEAFFDRFEAKQLAFTVNEEFEGSPEDKFKLVNRNDTPGQPEDQTTLPDSGDLDAVRENMYSSAPDQRPNQDVDNDSRPEENI